MKTSLLAFGASMLLCGCSQYDYQPPADEQQDKLPGQTTQESKQSIMTYK